MSRTAKTVTTLALLLILGGLAGADAYYNGRWTAAVTDGTDTTNTTNNSPMPSEGQATSAAQSAGTVTGVARNDGISYEDAAARAQVTLVENRENSLLRGFVEQEMQTVSFAVMTGGEENKDRAGSLFCGDGPTSKEAWIALKEALVPLFSKDVRDLRDETLQRPGKPIVNVLSFLDIAFYPRTITIMRSRARICEGRAEQGKQDVIDRLLEILMTE